MAARYAVAAAAVAAAWLAKAGIDPFLSTDDRPTFLWFIAASLFSGWYGGFGPGVFATILSTAVADVVLFKPPYHPEIRNAGQYAQMVVFGVISLLTSTIYERNQRSRRRIGEALASGRQLPGTTMEVPLEERAQLTRMEGEIGRVVAHAATLNDVLQGCTKALVAHAGAAFARVWVYDAGAEMLVLKASAGMYTHLDGPHGRVPLGKFKIGLIASERQPHLTNQVIGDPRVGDQEWAKRERMMAFAGYPLLVGGELHGVLAMFSRERLTDSTLAALALVSNSIAVAVQRREASAERERLLVASQEAREVAERSSRAKDEFIAVVSHELRTPLTAILGWARMLDGGLDKDETAEAVEVIQRNALAQSQLIEDLLDISRVISGKLRLDLRTVDLPAVVQEAVRTVLPTAESKGIRVESVLDPRAGPVSGDPDRLRQIVWNLLSNAVKFTPKKGKVQVRLSRVNSHVELTVSDTGIGISPEFLPRVFERFTQADSSSTRQHSGLGLGLGIARHLVELHGGEISAHSDGPGNGATFLVSLPIMIVHAGASKPESAHPTAPSAAAGEGHGNGVLPFRCPPELAGIRVVAVDDDADARKLLETVLTRCHAQVTMTKTAAEALEAVRRERPDVLLSDVEMAGEDGYGLIAKVRALPPEEGGNTPAAALTAYARVEDRTRALRAGFQLHVPKPVEPSELVAVVVNLAKRGKA